MKDKHIEYEALSAYVDGESTERNTIEAHLAQCARCRDEVENMHLMRASLRALERPAASTAFTESVLQRLEAEEAAHKGLFARAAASKYRWASALAAGLLVLLAGAWLFDLTGPSESNNTTSVGPMAVAPSEDAEAYPESADLPNTLDLELFSEMPPDSAMYAETTALFDPASEVMGYEEVLDSLDEVTYEEFVTAVATTLPDENETLDYGLYESEIEVWEDMMALDESSFRDAVDMLDEYLTRG